MSDCSDLIGLKYRLGADGTGGEIDCIHLCYICLDRLGIVAPPFNDAWYHSSRRLILRELYGWGYRVHKPRYTDGDILLIPQDSWAFAVIWQQGVLHADRYLKVVKWSTPRMFSKLHCFRKRNS